jgi:CheY-like chemotaxis protein
MARILLVEDEGAIAQTVAFALRAEGFEAVHALTGREALRLIAGGTFDLALLDVGLPDIDGYALLRELRRGRDLPAIFLTARQAKPNVCSVSNSAPTTTSPNRFRRVNWWRACAPCCAVGAHCRRAAASSTTPRGTACSFAVACST